LGFIISDAAEAYYKRRALLRGKAREKRPIMTRHVHPDSVAGLSYATSSVSKAANSLQKDKLHFYTLWALLIRMSMNKEHDVEMPEDVNALFNPPTG
jgi:hypothetical protein